MASQYEFGPTSEDFPERDEFSDFALVPKNGHELKCHKIKLAEASTVFCAMLRESSEETQTNKRTLNDFGQVTVESFLDYIYSDVKFVQDQKVYQKTFDEERLTPELLKLSHTYSVKNLLEKCIEHLMANIEDHNVVEIWTVAEMMEHPELKKATLGYLGKKRSQMLEVPGLTDSFQSPELVKSLVAYISGRMAADDDVIYIFIKCIHKRYQMHWHFTQVIQVKLSATVREMGHQVDYSLGERNGWKACKCLKGTFRQTDQQFRVLERNDCLEKDRIIESYNLKGGDRLECLVDYEKYV